VSASRQCARRTAKYVAAIIRKTVAMSVLRPARIITSRNGGEMHSSNANTAATLGELPSSRINR
jgi:hypothetical protein